MITRLIVVIALLSQAVTADEGAATRPSIESLQKETRRLREENDVLRRQVAKLMATTRTSTTQPVTKATTQPAAIEVELTADIDGSDEVHMTRGGLTWKHKEWDWPSNVTVNGKQWDPHEVMKWDELGLEVTEPPGVGRVIDRSGRDVVVVEPDADGPVVYFSDNPAGADTYSIKFTLTGARQREAKNK